MDEIDVLTVEGALLLMECVQTTAVTTMRMAAVINRYPELSPESAQKLLRETMMVFGTPTETPLGVCSWKRLKCAGATTRDRRIHL